MSYFDDNEDYIIYGSRTGRVPQRTKPGFTVTADDFDVVPDEQEACDPLTIALDQLRLYRAAFDLATRNGTRELVERWAGVRYRDVGPVEFRERCLRQARKAIDQSTEDLV